MPRIRKETNRYWSKEDKLKIINEVLEGESSCKVAMRYDISSGMLRGWIIKLKKEREAALENIKKPENPLSKYMNRKHLTEMKTLQYENMKLRIENERLKKGYISQETIFRSDQGSIYSSKAFNNAHINYNIVRSMSRAGTPTDNPIIESKNGWLKKEIYWDFKQEEYSSIKEYIVSIIHDHNTFRPSYALQYKTPIEYRTQLGFT